MKRLGAALFICCLFSLTVAAPSSAAIEARPLADLVPGPSSSEPDQLTAGETRVFATARDETGREPWILDSAGGRRIGDIYPGPQGSEISEVTALGDEFYFVANSPDAGYELWRTNGDSVEIVEDVVPGTAGSGPDGLRKFGSFVYFSTFTPATGRELWRADGSGAELVADIAQPGDIVICLGAGTITQWAYALPGQLAERDTKTATG